MDEIRTIPGTSRSHAFVERLIGPYGESFSIRHYSGATAILSTSWKPIKRITIGIGVTQDRRGSCPAQRSGAPSPATAHLDEIAGTDTATAFFRPRHPPELQFVTDKIPSTPVARLCGSLKPSAAGPQPQ